MLCALITNQLLQAYYFLEELYALDERTEIYLYFGTFTRSMLSMIEITLANWPPVCRAMQENVSQWTMPFFVVHKLIIGFAVVGVINGVFMQETFKVASSEPRIMLQQKRKELASLAKKMTLLFQQADESGDGTLSIEEFRGIMSNIEIATWLSAMDLDVTDVDQVFHLIANTNGEITSDELISGVARLKGGARAIDVAKLLREVSFLKEILFVAFGVDAEDVDLGDLAEDRNRSSQNSRREKSITRSEGSRYTIVSRNGSTEDGALEGDAVTHGRRWRPVYKPPKPSGGGQRPP